MQRSTQLTIAGILIIIESCLALIAALFMALFIWFEYFVPSHLGSVRLITEPFYVGLAIIVFEIAAFVLGLLSTASILKVKQFNLSTLGATFLLIAGFLFFTNLLVEAIPHVETSSIMGLWSFLQLYFALPIIILASMSIIILVSRKKEFDSKENTPLITLKAILVLTSVISALFALFSIVPYVGAVETARIQHTAFPSLSAYYPLATILVNTSIFFFTALGVFLLKKNNVHSLIILVVLSLFTALSLPFIFMSIYPWVGEFYKGLVTESPIIILSAIALALALLLQRKRIQVTPKSIDTHVNVS